MKAWLGLSVSALALACVVAPGGAQELLRTEPDRFSTEVLLAPSILMKAPISPALTLGVTRISDAPALDTIVTGQIAKPDMAAPAHMDPTTPVGGPDRAGAGTPPVAEPAALPAGEHAAAAGQMPKADDEDGPPEIVQEHAIARPGEDDALPADMPMASRPQPDGAHAAAAPAEIVERGPQPFDIIRTIQFLQDQVARGNGRAIRVQATLLRRFGPVFLAADRSVWTDGRNQRAAVLFVLSGGPPEVLRRLMESGDFGSDQKALFDGAMAYVQNDLDAAAKHLSSLDLVDMEPGLAAHIHLVLGQIQQTKDPESAVRHLDQARLLAPGGLIEEAALRMEVLIAEGRGDASAADRLARQYFDRYARSSYSANFEARFAAVYAGRKNEDPEVSVATILDVTGRLPPDSRRGLLLAVARRSLVDGKLKLAELASDAAGAIDGMPAAEKQRAELYATAARLGKSVTRDSAALLDGIDRAELHPEDVKLLDAAHSVVAEIERPLDPPKEPGSDTDAADTSPVFKRAQTLLDEISTDLGKAQ